ncbi:hypothetical protein [Methylomagnum ishizawai]|uniref:hypothetical protein n=1 Tax=Methylomagnum ishizawai TaxID=1760988 RepID=UPI001C381867|nr:hypothetical protein [Methylomagnum ishizawai]
MKTILKDFREFFPEHRDKTVYGILAAVDISEKMREEVLKAGVYVAEITMACSGWICRKGFSRWRIEPGFGAGPWRIFGCQARPAGMTPFPILRTG